MKNNVNYTVMIAVLAAVSATSVSAHAESTSKKPKHEQVLQQRQSRDILSLVEILKIVRPKIKGEIIETEFEIEHGKPVYEFKYITQSGQVLEIYIDAKTGRIIKEEID